MGEDNADAHMKRQIMGREVVVAVTDGKLEKNGVRFNLTPLFFLGGARSLVFEQGEFLESYIQRQKLAVA